MDPKVERLIAAWNEWKTAAAALGFSTSNALHGELPPELAHLEEHQPLGSCSRGRHRRQVRYDIAGDDPVRGLILIRAWDNDDEKDGPPECKHEPECKFFVMPEKKP